MQEVNSKLTARKSDSVPAGNSIPVAATANGNCARGVYSL
jgi:hypothetical protein